MQMNVEQIRTVLEFLYERREREDVYLNKLGEVDSAFSTAIFDNDFVNNLFEENTFLIEQLFGQELIDEVLWFLYDFRCSKNKRQVIEIDDVKYEITDLQSFLDYLQYGVGVIK